MRHIFKRLTSANCWIGDAIGAAGSLLGGILGNSSSSSANQANIDAAAALNSQNIAYQKEFAQNGIRWKVDDAKSAGLHPLAALGATTTSYTPVTASAAKTGNDYSFLGDIGRELGQSFTTKKTDVEKEIEAIKLAEAKLSLQAKGAEISHLNALTAKAQRDSQKMSPVPVISRSGSSSHNKGQNPARSHIPVIDPLGNVRQLPNPDVLEDRDLYSELKEIIYQMGQDVNFGFSSRKNRWKIPLTR